MVKQSHPGKGVGIVVIGCLRKLLLACGLILLPLQANAIDLTFKWDAPSDGPEPAGYIFYKSDTNGVSWQSVDVGDTLTYTWAGCEEDRLLLFSVTAYNDDGESNFAPGVWYNMAWKPPLQ